MKATISAKVAVLSSEMSRDQVTSLTATGSETVDRKALAFCHLPRSDSAKALRSAAISVAPNPENAPGEAGWVEATAVALAVCKPPGRSSGSVEAPAAAQAAMDAAAATATRREHFTKDTAFTAQTRTTEVSGSSRTIPDGRSMIRLSPNRTVRRQGPQASRSIHWIETKACTCVHSTRAGAVKGAVFLPGMTLTVMLRAFGTPRKDPVNVNRGNGAKSHVQGIVRRTHNAVQERQGG